MALENEEKNKKVNKDGNKVNKDGKYSITKIREFLFKLFFVLQSEKIDMEILEYFFEDNNIKNSENKEYIFKILDYRNENETKLKETINKYLRKDWEYSRISKISKSAIELAISEIEEGLPYKVAINEILKLVKKYEDEKAAKFVNGILASYIKDIIKE